MNMMFEYIWALYQSVKTGARWAFAALLFLGYFGPAFFKWKDNAPVAHMFELDKPWMGLFWLVSLIWLLFPLIVLVSNLPYIRPASLALLLIVNSGVLFTAFYEHSPIGPKTWQEMGRFDLWYVQAFYVLYALWFCMPVVTMIKRARTAKYITDLANTKTN